MCWSSVEMPPLSSRPACSPLIVMKIMPRFHYLIESTRDTSPRCLMPRTGWTRQMKTLNLYNNALSLEQHGKNMYVKPGGFYCVYLYFERAANEQTIENFIAFYYLYLINGLILCVFSLLIRRQGVLGTGNDPNIRAGSRNPAVWAGNGVVEPGVLGLFVFRTSGSAVVGMTQSMRGPAQAGPVRARAEITCTPYGGSCRDNSDQTQRTCKLGCLCMYGGSPLRRDGTTVNASEQSALTGLDERVAASGNFLLTCVGPPPLGAGVSSSLFSFPNRGSALGVRGSETACYVVIYTSEPP